MTETISARKRLLRHDRLIVAIGLAAAVALAWAYLAAGAGIDMSMAGMPMEPMPWSTFHARAHVHHVVGHDDCHDGAECYPHGTAVSRPIKRKQGALVSPSAEGMGLSQWLSPDMGRVFQPRRGPWHSGGLGNAPGLLDMAMMAKHQRHVWRGLFCLSRGSTSSRPVKERLPSAIARTRVLFLEPALATGALPEHCAWGSSMAATASAVAGF